MSNKGSFSGGFFLGTVIGGIVGGVLGTLIANKNKELLSPNNSVGIKNIKYTIDENDEDEILETKVDLEDKINQLNHAIDEVRFTLLKNSEAETIDER